MRGFWLVLLCLTVFEVHAAVIETTQQTTTGWCSPAVGKAGGNVTIICQGINPKALDWLNELLEKKDLELQDKVREAEEWARKYRELLQRLEQKGRDNVFAQQAKALLEEGKLEESGEALDRLLASGEQLVEQVASDHFNRAVVYALQFQLHKALPHYEKAYQYRPNNVKYAFQYALTLQQQHSHTKAEIVYQEALAIYRQLARDNPQAYLFNVAMTLNNLALLYSDTQQLSDSEQAYQEALAIYRQLARDNPQSYLLYMAGTLNNLGILYRRMQRLDDSAPPLNEALTIKRQLARDNPQAYLPDVARTLNNLGTLYSDMQRLNDSEQAYQEALATYRQLARDNSRAYLPYIATILNNLAVLYRRMQRPSDSEEAYQEALAAYRQLAQDNSQAYLPYIATILSNLGFLKFNQGNLQQAQTYIDEALTIRRRLWEKHAFVYGNDLAQSLGVEVMILLSVSGDQKLHVNGQGKIVG